MGRGSRFLGRSGRGGLAEGECEAEGGAGADAVAVELDVAAELSHGEGGAVEAEAVAVFLGGEAVIEHACAVFGGDADAVVGHVEMDGAIAIGKA